MDKQLRKDRKDLNNTINQLDLTGIYKTLHKTIVEYTLFSNPTEQDTGISHIMGHKTHFNKLKINLN